MGDVQLEWVTARFITLTLFNFCQMVLGEIRRFLVVYLVFLIGFSAGIFGYIHECP